MDRLKLHPVLDELVKRTITEMKDVVSRCTDCVEQLEDGALLPALGALSGCAERIRDAVVILGATCRWQIAFNRTAQTSGGATQKAPEGD